MFVCSALPELEEDAVLAVIPNRMSTDNVMDMVLMSAGADDLIADDDKQAFQKDMERWQNEFVEKSEFRKEWVAEKRNATQKTRISRRIASTFDNDAGHTIQEGEWPMGRISKEFAASICPMPARIYEDVVNGRWQVFWKGLGTRSRAWNCHGHTEAARLVLEWAWLESLTRAGLTAAACPIRGLISASHLGVAESAAPGAASGSAP